MRRLGIFVMVCLFAVAMSCGSSNSNGGAGGSGGGTGGTATGGSSGGTSTAATGGSSGGTSTAATGGSGGGATATGGSSGGATAAGGGGGGTGAGSCVLPSCLKDLGAGCVESGSCAMQTDLETSNSNTCYANGVTEMMIHDVMSDDRTLTVKKGSSTCFSTVFNGNDVYSNTGAITVNDASGTSVASVRYDDTLTFYFVTCTGGQEVALDPSCSKVWPVSVLMGSGCQEEGGCTP